MFLKLKIDICVCWDFGHSRVEEREEEFRAIGWNLEERRKMKFVGIEMKYICL